MELHLSTIVFALVNFFVMLAIVKFFFYKPIIKVLDARKESIQNDLMQAQEAHEAALEHKKAYEESLKEAHKKASEILEEAKRLGEEARQNIIDEANEEAKRATERAMQSIHHERDKALEDLRKEVAELAGLVAEKILEREITAQDHHDMVASFIQKVDEGKC